MLHDKSEHFFYFSFQVDIASFTNKHYLGSTGNTYIPARLKKK